MPLARLDPATSVRSRIVWAVMLCAVTLGILGMHGLAQTGDAQQPVGHHVVQVVDLDSASATPGSPTTVSDDSSPGETAGLMTTCLMVLVPAVAVGLWILGRSRVGGWRLRRQPALAIRALLLAVPPQPLWRNLSVLRV